MDELEISGNPDLLMTFDGRVVELFGLSQATRFPIQWLRIEIAEPGRDDAIRVTLSSKTGRPGAAVFQVGPEDAEPARIFLERVQAALPCS